MSDIQPRATFADDMDDQRIQQRRGNQPVGWAGLAMFGAMVMMLLGTFQALAGLIALLDDGYYAVGSGQLAVQASYTAWAWVHLLIGALAVVTGMGLMTGALWARVIGLFICL